MNREIKHRGICIDDGIWRYGYLVEHGDRCYIFTGGLDTTGLCPIWDKTEVFPETVGQFTGRHDRNVKGIYENDIIDTPNDKSILVSWNEKHASFCLDKNGWMYNHFFGEAVEPENCEIVGNIHANPELMGVNNER